MALFTAPRTKFNDIAAGNIFISSRGGRGGEGGIPVATASAISENLSDVLHAVADRRGERGRWEGGGGTNEIFRGAKGAWLVGNP